MAVERVMATATPAVLKWARESAGLSLEDAAKRIPVPVAKLTAAESGSGQLTFSQLKSASHVYKRPLAVFFLDAPPAQPTPVPDFRRVPAALGSDLSSELHLELRRMNRKREIAASLNTEKYDWSYVGEAKLDMDPDAIAADLRKSLGVNAQAKKFWHDEYSTLKWWRDAIESIGTLVLYFRRVDTDEVRAFSIAKQPFPVVALNRADPPRARLFSLLHEFTHVLLGQSGMCDIAVDDYQTNVDRRRIEIFCNAVAASTLVPHAELVAVDAVKRHARGTRWTDTELGHIAGEFGVSMEVALRRLLTFDLATDEEYKAYRAKLQIPVAANEDIREKGYQITMRTQGETYVRIVLDALHRDEVTAADVSDYLDMKLDHLDELERAIAGKRSR